MAAGSKFILGGVSQGMKEIFYFHKVKLYIAGSYIETMVGFSDRLSVAGLLGHIGLFDNFIVTFDNTPDPPCFEVLRIQRN